MKDSNNSLEFKTAYEWMVERMKEGEGKGKGEKVRKYLAGYIDLGFLGRKEAYLFKNDKKEKDNHPAFRLMVREGDTWKEAGAFWIREIKPKEETFDFV